MLLGHLKQLVEVEAALVAVVELGEERLKLLRAEPGNKERDGLGISGTGKGLGTQS